MVEGLGARAFGIAPAADIGKGNHARLRLRAGDGGPRRQLVTRRRRADDIGLDDDIGGTADHQQMLDIVAADQHQPPAAVNGGSIDHRQARHPATIWVGADPVAGESADQPCHNADQRQHRHKREEKC